MSNESVVVEDETNAAQEALARAFVGDTVIEEVIRGGTAAIEADTGIINVNLWCEGCLTCTHMGLGEDENEACHVSQGNQDCPAGKVKVVFVSELNRERRRYAKALKSAQDLLADAKTGALKLLAIQQVAQIASSLSETDANRLLSELGINV